MNEHYISKTYSWTVCPWLADVFFFISEKDKGNPYFIYRPSDNTGRDFKDTTFMKPLSLCLCLFPSPVM